jgi:hypothetical protein
VRDAGWVDDELITRDEVIGLLFNVADMAESLRTLEAVLGGEDGEEEDDGG